MLLAVVLAAGLAACSHTDRRPSPELRGQVRPVTTLAYAAELEAAVARVTVAGREYRVAAADAWRDFMPGAATRLTWSDGGRGLAAAVRVESVDGGAIDPGLVPVELVVLLNGLAWVVPADSTRPVIGELLASAAGGPAWNPGTRVDVALVLLHDVHGLVILRADGVEIVRVS